MQINNKERGLYLLSKGFKTWFLFAFKAVEGKDFIQDKVHDKSFILYQNIFNQSEDASRVCLNQPPRSGKTSLMLYFFVFAALQYECNFIYTSFNSALLRNAREGIEKIVKSEWFDAFYGREAFKLSLEEKEAEFEDSFFKSQQKEKLTNTFIQLGKSTIFLTPLGSTTGFGAGVIGAQGYSGGIFLDDINKVTDTITDKTLNQKVRDFFSTNILTRMNNEKINILNNQQRISVSDISQYLFEKYNFKPCIIPLIDENGECNIASQYSPARIAELKLDNRTFMAQYQQKPEPKSDITFIGQIFNYRELKQATKRNIPYEISPYVAIGVDPKREGHDSFSIILRSSKNSKVLFYDFRAIDTQTAADIIVKNIKMYEPNDINIDSGKGEAVIDELRRRGVRNVNEIKFGAESHRNDAFNKRSAMYNDLFDWIKAGGVLPDYADLLEELAALEAAEDEKKRFKLAPKRKILERIGRSPGLADALALTFAIPRLVSPSGMQSRYQSFRIKNDFRHKLMEN